MNKNLTLSQLTVEGEGVVADPLRVPVGWCRDVCMNSEELAAYLGVNVSFLDDLRRAKKIPAMNLGFKTKRYHLPTVLMALQRGR